MSCPTIPSAVRSCAAWKARIAALVFGLFVVRLSGVYLAMLTLAFAQIVWAGAFQWVGVTGGDDPYNRATYPALFAAITSTKNGLTANGSAVVTAIGTTARLGAGMAMEGRP